MVLRVECYKECERAGQRWLRFQEKRGKEHEVPVHSKASELSWFCKSRAFCEDFHDVTEKHEDWLRTRFNS